MRINTRFVTSATHNRTGFAWKWMGAAASGAMNELKAGGAVLAVNFKRSFYE
jgi:hypothetical protein